MAKLGVVTKSDVKAIIENRLPKWTNISQSQVPKAVESTLNDALGAIYSNSNNGLKSALLNIDEQALREVLRSEPTPKVSEAEMCSLVYTDALAVNIVCSILFYTRFIVPVSWKWLGRWWTEPEATTTYAIGRKCRRQWLTPSRARAFVIPSNEAVQDTAQLGVAGRYKG